MRNAYPEYRWSRLPWLDQIPSHWEIQKLKYNTSTNDDVLSENEDPLREVLYVDIGSISPSKGITSVEEMVFEDAPTRARRLVKDGDTIVSTVRTYLRAVAPVHQPSPEMVVSTGFAVIRPREIDSRYCSWVLRENRLIEHVVANSNGVSYPAINATQIGEIFVTLPPIAEQRTIAAYLDHETVRIDQLITKHELLIERLAEYRNAVITRTVTKGLPADAARDAGLDPEPCLKTSNIEWIGDIPEHWTTCRIRHQFTTANGGTPNTNEEEYRDGKIIWVTPEDLGQNVGAFIGESNRSITTLGVANSSAQVCPEGSIIVSTRAPIGHLAITAAETTTNQGCRTLVPKNDVDSTFAYYTLLASREVIQSRGKGSTFMEISAADLKAHEFIAPPVAEQRAIAQYLDQKTARIDVLSERAATAIERLNEYRTALITAAVTGKIDVREPGAAEEPTE